MRLPRLFLFAAPVCVAGFLRAASFDDRVEALFRPPLAEMMALSPNGQRVAYTSRFGGDLAIVIMDFSHPGRRRTLMVDAGRDTPAATDQPPEQLRFLRWATSDRLVFAPFERVVPLPPVTDENGRVVPHPDGPTIVSPIIAVDANGQQRGTLVDAHHFTETPAEARRTLADLLRTPKELATTRDESVRWRMPHLDIVGFLPGDREQLIIRTHGAYSIPMQHLVDIRSGNVREFGGGWQPPPGEPHVFDWLRLEVVGERKAAAQPMTAWRDGELGRVQRELELKFPRRVVEILDWSETRARVLFRVTGGSDPGRVFVFQRPEDLVLEILRCAPWLNAAALNDTRFFACEAPDGARLSGYVTWPTKPRLAPPPLLVVFPSEFPGRAEAAFDPEAQIFADLGFAVARLNHRSVAGVRAEDVAALRTAPDRVSVDDARAAIEWIAARHGNRAFDRARVATLGRGFGGYLAVRALQLQPGVFRCGVAIDGPMGWKKPSVLDPAEALTNPVLLLVEPGRSAAIDASTAELRARLESLGRTTGHFELEAGFAAAEPASRASIYRRIEVFLNLHLDINAVQNGEAAKEAR